MPRFLTRHTMACMTRQGAQHLAASLPSTGEIRLLRFLINMTAEESTASPITIVTNWARALKK